MQCTVQVVVQTVVLCNDTVLELSVCIKAIRTLREAAVTHPFAIVGPVDDQRTIRLGVIETAIKFEHTHVNTDTVDVVVLDAAFLDNAVLELLVMGNHAVFIEVVPPLRQQPVGLFCRDPEVLTAIRQHILHSLAVHIKVVVQIVTVRILHLCKALVPYMPTVFQPIRAVVFLAQTVLADRSELRDIDGIFAYGCKLLIPTLELVTVVLILVLLRILAGILGNGSLKNRISAQDTTILILPSDSDSGLGNLRALLDQFIADRAVFVTGVAGRCERRLDRIASLQLVASSRDHFLGNKNLVADGAVLARGLAGFGAGGCNSFVDYFRMPLSRNLFLRYKHFVANRAMFAFGLAGRGAGSCNSFVDHLGMTLSRNLFLCYEHFIANRAVFTLSLAGFGAGSCNSFVDYFRMPLSRNLFLCYKHFIANRAMFAFGLAGFGAGGFNCRVDDLGVPLRGNLFLCNKNLVADGAMFALGLAGCGAGGVDCRVDDLGVSLRGNFLLCNDDRVADRAMLALGLAGCGAGGFNCRVDDLGVSLRGNFLLCNDDRVADRAMFALGLAGFRAGRLDPCVNDLGMSLGGNLFLRFDNRSADRAADAIRQTRFGTGCGLAHNGLLSVAGRRYHFHTGEDRPTNGALRTGCMTSLGAGSGLFRNFNRSMSSCVDCFGLGCIANCAGVGLDTGILTGRRGRDLALIPTVALGGNLFLCYKHFIANRAMFALGLAGFGAGRFDCRVDDLGVSLGGNSRAGAYFLAAILAVGIAGIAILGASGGFRVTKFCVLM